MYRKLINRVPCIFTGDTPSRVIYRYYAVSVTGHILLAPLRDREFFTENRGTHVR